MPSDDSNVTPLPRRDVIRDMSDSELARVVNLLLDWTRTNTQRISEHSKATAARIEAFERASAQLRDSDRLQYDLMRQTAQRDREELVEAIRNMRNDFVESINAQGAETALLRREVTRLGQIIAAMTGQTTDGASKVKRYGPAVVGGGGAVVILLELAKAVTQVLQ